MHLRYLVGCCDQPHSVELFLWDDLEPHTQTFFSGYFKKPGKHVVRRINSKTGFLKFNECKTWVLLQVVWSAALSIPGHGSCLNFIEIR